jgi:hypothetical protein
MRRLVWAAVVLITSTLPVPALADDLNLSLSKEKLRHVNGGVSQLLTLKNNTGVALAMVGIECGFLRGDTLVDTGGDALHNVAAGQTVYADIVSTATDANRTDCRIAYTIKATGE